VKKTHHGTKKHAGSGKHHASAKHHPSHSPAHHHHVGGTHHPPHSHVVGKHPKHTKAHKWSPGLDVASCAIDALAANLRLSGRAVKDADVLDLYWHITDDPDCGATLPGAFEAAANHGLGGAYLLDARPAAALTDGVVLGIDLTERHALVVDGHGVWTWGQWRPASCDLLSAADEAWELTWL
jgi:hypothetical protein